MKYRSLFVCLVLAAACLTTVVGAEEIALNDIKVGTRETAVFAGIGRNYHYPKATKEIFRFDMIGVRVSRQISPSVALGYELGTGLGYLKNDNPVTWGTICYQQYIDAHRSDALTLDLSIGIMRFRDRVPELGTHANFTERLGFTYKWKDGGNTGWFVNASFSHMSNAGLEHPNIGINCAYLTFGRSWYGFE